MSVFNSVFCASDVSSYFTRYTHTACPRMTPPRPYRRLWLYCAAALRVYSIQARALYSRLFIRLSFNCPICRRVVTASRRLFSPCSKARITMEADARSLVRRRYREDSHVLSERRHRQKRALAARYLKFSRPLSMQRR